MHSIFLPVQRLCVMWQRGSAFLMRRHHHHHPQLKPAAASSLFLALARRTLSSGVVEDETTLWARAMGEKYGPGAYKLFRPLYKDLADEMRREVNARPPPPMAGWSVQHDETVNIAVFTRSADEEARLGRVVAYSPIEMANPPKINELLYFVDWFPVEVLVARNGVIVHFSMAANEGGMHMRNVRAYKEETDDLLLSTTDDAMWVRQNLYYDGPCLWHLELDMQNELYDVMQDHGITLNWIRWAAEWVCFLEHVAYVRWNLGMLEQLIPSEQRGAEEDFLTSEEKEELSKPLEEWLEGRYA